jgi:hypothetical protein
VTIGAAGAFDPGDDSVSINLAAGESIHCTFENSTQSSITIIKDAAPDDPQDFTFMTTGPGISNFTLDDDADGTLPNTRQFPGLAAGSRTITEAGATGFTLSNIVCTGATNSTIRIGNTGGFDPGDTSVTIGLVPGEDIVCTFVNNKQGSITIVKDSVPDDAQNVGFTATGSGVGNFTLDDDADAVLSSTRQFPGLMPGSRIITETVPTGFTLTDIVCTGATNSTVRSRR